MLLLECYITDIPIIEGEGEFEEFDFESDEHSRMKRQTETYEYTPTKTRCPLLLVADYRFYQEMGASSTKTTINYLVCDSIHWHKKYPLILYVYYLSE